MEVMKKPVVRTVILHAPLPLHVCMGGIQRGKICSPKRPLLPLLGFTETTCVIQGAGGSRTRMWNF